MLTVIGPAIAVWLMVIDYTNAQLHFSESLGMQAATLFTLLLSDVRLSSAPMQDCDCGSSLRTR